VRRLSLVQELLPFAVVVAAWQLAAASARLSPVALPAPSAVVRAFAEAAAQGMVSAYTSLTLQRLGLAAALSILVAVPVGLLIGLSRTAAQYCLPALRFTQSLSGIAWLPLFIIWFGFGETTVLVTVAYTFVFPLIYNTVVGLQTIPRVLVQSVRTLGGGRRELILHVLLPGALPYILTGVRLGFAYGWREVIAAEMLLGSGGLGFFIFKAQSFNLTDRIVAGMVLIGVLWTLIDYLLLQPVEESTVRRWGLVQR
jgi:taurine transport system permease protein